MQSKLRKQYNHICFVRTLNRGAPQGLELWVAQTLPQNTNLPLTGLTRGCISVADQTVEQLFYQHIALCLITTAFWKAKNIYFFPTNKLYWELITHNANSIKSVSNLTAASRTCL